MMMMMNDDDDDDERWSLSGVILVSPVLQTLPLWDLVVNRLRQCAAPFLEAGSARAAEFKVSNNKKYSIAAVSQTQTPGELHTTG
jgi:hypothetical protein